MVFLPSNDSKKVLLNELHMIWKFLKFWNQDSYKFKNVTSFPWAGIKLSFKQGTHGLDCVVGFKSRTKQSLQIILNASSAFLWGDI